MKFRLISRQGVLEGTGEIPDAFAGRLSIIIWAGRCFMVGSEETHYDDQGAAHEAAGFFEVLGQALDHHQVTPPHKVAERWTSPTAIGRMAEKAPDVVDSVAPGYVRDSGSDYMARRGEFGALAQQEARDRAMGTEALPEGARPVRRRVEPIGSPDGRPSLYMDGGPVDDSGERIRWDVVDCNDPRPNPALVREIGEPESDKALWALGDPEAKPQTFLGLKPVPVLHEGATLREAMEKCEAAQDRLDVPPPGWVRPAIVDGPDGAKDDPNLSLPRGIRRVPPLPDGGIKPPRRRGEPS